MRAHQAMNAQTWLLLIVLSVLWGGSFFFFKILVAELPPLTIVMVRVVIASLALLAFLYLGRQSLPKGGTVWRAFFVMALLNNVMPFSLIVWGEIHISSGLAAILNATSPVFSVLVAYFTGSERLSINRAAGVLLGLVGVALLIGPQALRGLSLTSLAQLGVLLASLLYACGASYGRRFQSMNISPVAVSAGQLTAAAVIMIPLTFSLDRPWTFAHPPSLIAWSALLALALLSTAVAYIIYFQILASAGATNALLVTFLSPISALCLGGLVLKEHVSALDLGGMLVIFVGLATLDGRIFSLLRRRDVQPI